ncbi:hypothetical protein [Allocoleopsis sp.]|uniref:hypothetical protein n=1 Tax=Allocoleopsis sp. TaxID=3088169 RepID=UPI002FD24F23
MSFLPVEKFTITTNLTPEEVRRRLSEQIEPSQLFRSWPSFGKPYEGEISGDYFEIKRINRFWRSIPPVIEGKIIPKANGCQIIIKITPPLGTTIISTFFLVYVLVMIPSFMSSTDIIVFLVFVYFSILILFQIDAARDKNLLENLFSS